MSDETKIVINLKGEAARVGIQRTDCDPIFFTVKGDLAEVLGTVPVFLDEAGARWQTSPRYPKSELSTPTLAPAPAAAVSRTVPVTAAKPKVQQAMF